MSGGGTQPAGISPYGLGEPDTALFTPGGAINVNPSTGLQEGARRIDPRTRQYTFNAYGRLDGMPSTRQRVMLAVMTEFGSSSMRELGQTLKELQTIGSDYAKQVDARLTRAVQSLIDEGAISLLGIDVARADGRDGSRNVVRFIDLTTGQPDRVDI